MRGAATRIALILFMASTATAVLLAGCGPPPGGFQGMAYVKEPGGGYGPAIPGAEIRFLREDGSGSKSVTTDDNGSYQIPLSQGRYWVTATHPGYEDYATAPGFFVVSGDAYQIGNIFMMEPRVTTVLLVRHAERGNDHLTSAGEERRDKLADVARRAGVTAVYATSANRTQQTVQALAEQWMLDVTPEDSPSALANNRLLTDHLGDVALVASHSGGFGGPYSTVPNVTAALGAEQCTGAIGEYDNLFIVSRETNGAGKTNVLNLQYGLPDGSGSGDGIDCTNHMTTLLLAPPAEAGAAGVARGTKLAHVVGKAGVAAVFAPGPSQEPAHTLGVELGLPVQTYDAGNIQALVADIQAAYATQVVAVVGDKDAMSNIITRLGGAPYPVIYAGERDSLLVVTVHQPGEARVLSLEFGDPSP